MASPPGSAAETTRLRAHLADAQADLQRHGDTLSKLQAELMMVRQELSVARAGGVQLRGLLSRAEAAASTAAAIGTQNTALQRDILRLQAGMAELRANIDAIHASLSWRISAPVRIIGRLLRRR